MGDSSFQVIEPKDWTVSVVFPDGRTEKISVQNISKVSDLKTKIDRAGGVSPSDQKLEVGLVYQGRIL